MYGEGHYDHGQGRCSQGKTVLRVGTGKDDGRKDYVEGNKSIMRRVLTREEAYELIDAIKTIDKLWVSDEKQRENKYKEALRTCDCKEWVGIIKTLYLRKKDRMVRGKRLTEVDERYMKKAKENLQGELSVTLGISEMEVEQFILNRIGEEDNR